MMPKGWKRLFGIRFERLMKTSMKIAALTLALCVAVTPLSAARRRAVAPPAALSLEFVHIPAAGTSLMSTGSDAWVDLDTVSQQAGSMGKSLRVRRQIGIRVLRAGGVAWGTAMVTARLSAPDGRASLRVDGQTLGRTPVVVNARAAVGSLSIHTLEIEVPEGVPQGPFSASISWEVTTQ